MILILKWLHLAFSHLAIVPEGEKAETGVQVPFKMNTGFSILTTSNEISASSQWPSSTEVIPVPAASIGIKENSFFQVFLSNHILSVVQKNRKCMTSHKFVILWPSMIERKAT